MRSFQDKSYDFKQKEFLNLTENLENHLASFSNINPPALYEIKIRIFESNHLQVVIKEGVS